jgi:hypothetical protein
MVNDMQKIGKENFKFEILRFCDNKSQLAYYEAKEQFDKEPGLYKLFKLQCIDLLILTEMEANGLVYDPVLCNKIKDEVQHELDGVMKELQSVYKDVPINFGSKEQPPTLVACTLC